MSYTVKDYRAAADLFWGDAGAFAIDTFMRLNCAYFASRLPPLPIVIGLTAYGHCIGLTRSKPTLPRITLASGIFRSARKVEDTLLHELVHAELQLAGLDSHHNSDSWCRRITELSPMVLGTKINAAPVKPRRSGKTVSRRPLPDHLSQGDLARWPHSLRPADYYIGDRHIPVDTY